MPKVKWAVIALLSGFVFATIMFCSGNVSYAVAGGTVLPLLYKVGETYAEAKSSQRSKLQNDQRHEVVKGMLALQVEQHDQLLSEAEQQKESGVREQERRQQIRAEVAQLVATGRQHQIVLQAAVDAAHNGSTYYPSKEPAIAEAEETVREWLMQTPIRLDELSSGLSAIFYAGKPTKTRGPFIKTRSDLDAELNQHFDNLSRIIAMFS